MVSTGYGSSAVEILTQLFYQVFNVTVSTDNPVGVLGRPLAKLSDSFTAVDLGPLPDTLPDFVLSSEGWTFTETVLPDAAPPPEPADEEAQKKATT